MYASATGTTGTVSLEFSHLLAWLNVRAKVVNTTTKTANIVITGLTLTQPRTNGTYTVATGIWSTTAAKAARGTGTISRSVGTSFATAGDFLLIPQDVADAGMTVNYTLNGEAKTLTVPAAKLPDMSAGMGKKFVFDLTFNISEAGVEYGCKIVPWNENLQQVGGGQYTLKVSTDHILFPADVGDYAVTAQTNYDATAAATGGYDAGLFTTIAYDDPLVTGWLSIQNVTGMNGSADRTFRIKATANTDGERSAIVKVAAANFTKIIHVTQQPELPFVDPGDITGSGNANIITYIGAFWRADQLGERLISIPVANSNYAGNWAVQVLDMGKGFNEGDILFSAWDGTLPNDSKIPDTDALTDGKTCLTNNTVASGGSITFRIGLKQTIGATDHRYARVVVSFGVNSSIPYYYKRVIYIRQGDAPDYLMHTDDAINSNAISANARPLARRFSAYNLTHPDLKSGVAKGGALIDDNNTHPQIPLRSALSAADAPNYFTEYPTQAGAFFQWAIDPEEAGASLYLRRAYHPSSTTTEVISNWKRYAALSYWDTIEDDNESCPPGYHRPNDGSTSADESGQFDSEMRQSLFYNPDGGGANNSVWGYYADGFFDRRETGLQKANIGMDMGANKAVEWDTNEVAYIGRLFYNKNDKSSHYNASLFFPASGYRVGGSSGYLGYPGGYGNYWTSSARNDGSVNDKNAWYLSIGSGSSRASQSYSARSIGMPVRCVADEHGE